MGILDKILGHDGKTQPDAAPQTPEMEAPECPHTALAQHWDTVADMGKKELATYNCESCGRSFTYEQAAPILEHPPEVLIASGRDSERVERESQE
jgi:hypothetical protein